MSENKIYGINGPVVTIKGKTDLEMMEMVYVGNSRLVGEVIGITDDATTVQVYEETGGLRPGEPVFSTGSPMCVTLGPGILTNIFDGIERPLRDIEAVSGAFIARGIDVPAVSKDKKWQVTLKVKEGDIVKGGDIFAECPETAVITHRAMVPVNI
ncbi:MAG: V-type ATP synthase subunit A, partial [Candidatus Fimenecus sp.]